MAIRKNKKRIDPRYFLSETTYRDEEEIEQLKEAAPTPADVTRAPSPSIAADYTDNQADHRSRNNALIELINSRGFSPLRDAFEKTYRNNYNYGAEGPEGGVPTEDAYGLAAALEWFLEDREAGYVWKNARVDSPREASSLEQIKKQLLETAKTGAVKATRALTKDSSWGPVMGAPGMNAAAQEWEYLIKILNGKNPEYRDAWQQYGKPYIDAILR